MKNRLLTIAAHVLGGLAFLALPYIFAPEGFSPFDNPHEHTKLSSYLLILVYFYLNYLLLIPRLFFTRQYVWFGVCSLVCFWVIAFVIGGQGPPPPGMHGYPGPHPMPHPPMDIDLSQKFFLFLLALFLSLSLRIADRWRAAEKARLSTELSYLKAQINPHFLFNTLNSIYSLALEKSDATADAIVRLSSFMRYVIREAHDDRVALPKELDYISHYVALQQLRLDDTATVDFQVSGDPAGLEIAPLLLISFIENAFKYGVNPDGKSGIRIRVDILGDTLHLLVENSKVRVFQDEQTGIGLENTRARLRLLYPRRHELTIRDEGTTFAVNLTLRLS